MSEPIIVQQYGELQTVDEAANHRDLEGTAADEALFPQSESGELRKRWEKVQTEFVDDPRGSVEKADQVVGDTIKRLAEVFAEQRTRLEVEWDKSDNVSTEDLRQALRKYRSFFDRLLSAR
jgi:hypothetical protein